MFLLKTNYWRSRHNLTDAALDHLLHMLSEALLPTGNNLPKTVRFFNKCIMQNSDMNVAYRSADKTFITFDIKAQLERIMRGKKNIVTKNYSKNIQFNGRPLNNTNSACNI